MTQEQQEALESLQPLEAVADWDALALSLDQAPDDTPINIRSRTWQPT